MESNDDDDDDNDDDESPPSEIHLLATVSRITVDVLRHKVRNQDPQKSVAYEIIS